MLKKKLNKQIQEAIEAESTSDPQKESLKNTQNQLSKAKNEKDYTAVVVELIKIIGVLIKVFNDSD